MTDKLFDTYSEILSKFIYYLSKPNKDNLISFMEGYSEGRGDEKLIEYLKLYLYHNYQINLKYNTWVQQVDHYSFIKSLNWFEGFSDLLSEILNQKQCFPKSDDTVTLDFLSEIPKGKPKQNIQLSNGVSLKKGSLIQLTDKINEDYKQTKFYDASLRNPSWELFYPSKEDFKYIDFYHNKSIYFEDGTNHLVTIFGKARKLFSESILEVEALAIQKGEIIIYTKLFRINVEKALQENELKILYKKNQEYNITDFSGLIDRMEQYEMGLFSTYDLTQEINNWCFYHLQDLKKEWHKYHFSMGMNWNKIDT